jgi:hypothetical protein
VTRFWTVLVLVLYGVAGNAACDVTWLALTGHSAPDLLALGCGMAVIYLMWPVVMRWERSEQ